MNEFNRELGNKIFSYRKVNMTTTQLAELSGTSQGNISKIENGVVTVNIQLLIKICESLGVTLTDILPGENFENNQINDANRLQILAILNNMSEGDLNIILTFLKKIKKTDITSALKGIITIVDVFGNLKENETEVLIPLFETIINKAKDK
ncbi:helix-turn-helix transcriptional regulator [Niallia taxi]|nr:helix-turn-helix transcriptional regulator [Niallia taxi]MDE5055330.1 helix-turn-helix transcriptional regulator [Niallia taxi]